jgi:hypothetical protein
MGVKTLTPDMLRTSTTKSIQKSLPQCCGAHKLAFFLAYCQSREESCDFLKHAVTISIPDLFELHFFVVTRKAVGHLQLFFCLFLLREKSHFGLC